MITAYPIIKFQMWDTIKKQLFLWEDPIGRMLMMAGLVNDVPQFRLLPFTGLLDTNGKELYLDDVVDITVKNQWGSLEKWLVQVSYVPDMALYMFNFRDKKIIPAQIIKIEKIGNLNANPQLLDI